MRRIIRKFAQNKQTKRQTKRQTEISNTEATLIPSGSSGGAGQYLNLIKLDLGKTTGRMWFTGRNQTFVSSPMGKNTISKVIFYFHIIIFS